jgi:Ribose/xylose/arabinose/galactoside ABC-type transport systems, permease components
MIAIARIRRMVLRPELASVAGCAVAFIYFTLATPLFLSKDTFVPATSLAAQYGMVAVGVTLLMIGGQFDLSVGAIVGLTGWSLYFFGDASQMNMRPELAILFALGFGTLLGLVNGILVVRTGLASFIVTLATSMVFRGWLTMNTSGFPVVVRFPKEYSDILSGTNLFGFRTSVLWFVLAALIATWFLLRTRTGNWTFAIGQNANAARNLGVPVQRTTVMLFAISGFTAALAGVIVASQYSSIDANRGVGWELYAIAIAVIGGTLLTGGYGSVIGAVLGALFYAVVEGGLVLIGLQGYWVNISLGVALILAVLVNRIIVSKVMASPERVPLDQPNPPRGTVGEDLEPQGRPVA